jgi:hypothetical protein
MKRTLEEVVASNRISLGTAKEYSDLCEAIRRWIKDIFDGSGVKLDDVLARSPKKILIQRDMTGKTKRILKRVAQQEEEAARMVDGSTQPFSGRLSLIGGKGDVKSKDYLIEAKQTAYGSMGIKVEWIEKICNEAVGLGLEPLLHLRFDSIGNQFPKDWCLVSSREFERLKDAAKCSSGSE